MNDQTTLPPDQEKPAVQAGVHLSLREIFFIVALCAVFAWCLSIVGFDNFLFWLACIASLIMVALFVKLGRSEKSRWAMVLIPFPFLMCGLNPLLSSVAVGANALLLLIAGLVVTSWPRQSRKRLWTIGASTTAIAFVLAVWFGWSRSQFFVDLRAEFAIQSMAPRLAYEKESKRPTHDFSSASSDVTRELHEFEAELQLYLDGWDRQYQLRRLHSRQAENFVMAQGFGIARLSLPDERFLEKVPLTNLSFRGGGASENGWPWAQWQVNSRAPVANDANLPRSLHAYSRIDFLHPEGFGALMSAEQKQVAGFIPHAFHMSPIDQLGQTNHWQIANLQLVSLLKFDEPRVYVLDHLPRMDQLSSENVPTRELDEFETASLEKLWTQEDLVILDDGAETIRMLGSLRAAQQCLDCHSVNRGDLLGAFSYELRRLSRLNTASPGDSSSETDGESVVGQAEVVDR